MMAMVGAAALAALAGIIVRRQNATAANTEAIREEFNERGFIVFPGLLADAPRVRAELEALLENATGATSDWNAVSGHDGAEFVLAVDERGAPVPGRVMKVQGAALAAPVVLETLRDPQILEKVRMLYGSLGRPRKAGVDIFGTKIFPVWPGGSSVSWHQDGHYFGTASTQIISVAVYLEETTRENGCLRVIPGSHLGGVAAHHPGEGADAQGEWAAPDEQQAEDVEVHAGSVVLFNSMLMHGAHKNRSEKRTRFSLFGHFVPRELSFEWRGTDFSSGVYPDRHAMY